ncbi:elongator complex protein 1 [Trichogramma pretiosum]|uniref:elongator complex protein 1 n=1 Tax=Trichogramma pretiosum TaxID=7493 RepID=UPI0006C94781|nr:elongator complex protein 1 [Trichogramma pretiosum]
MRNLTVNTQKTCLFTDTEALSQEFKCCYDDDNDVYYLMQPEEKRIIAISGVDNRILLDDRLSLRNNLAVPVGITYSSIQDELYVAFDAGFVIEVKKISSNEMRYAEIDDYKKGLFSINMSPDHEIVVLVTREYEVITLNADYKQLNKVSLKTEEFGEKQFITVGWGSKGTQFHGSEGKAARNVSSVQGRTELDDCMPRITWKGDGTMFAVSYIDLESQARRFRVFSREGTLYYTSELVQGLEACLSWKPSGNLIAGTRKLPNKHTVALFEKNGLMHREFVLPFGGQKILIMDLIWSRDSDILAILHKDVNSNLTSIHLWAEKNYHWYLKQTIFYPPDNPILFATWGQQHGKDLLVLSAKSTSTYTFRWKIDHSRGLTADDGAVVSVINGSNVHMTCFKDGIVPPPMAQQILEFAGPVNALSFAPPGCELNTNEFLVLLSNNKLYKFESAKDEGKLVYKTNSSYIINLPLEEPEKYSLNLINHLLWYTPKLVLCSLATGLKSSLCKIELSNIENLDKILIDLTIIKEMPGQIQHILTSSATGDAYIVCDNKLYTYSVVSGLEKSSLYLGDEPPVKLEFVQFGSREVIVNLSRKHVLYVGGKQVANNVTSFHVHSEFFLITTLQHTLIAFRLDEDGLMQLENKDLTIQPWTMEDSKAQRIQELSIRRVERGSTLVTVLPKDCKVILQMPRGNLECIQPRALSLVIIGTYIDNLEFLSAFDLMRKQRIDLNLLYDHSPDTFMNNAEKFVSDVKKSSWLSLFLSELRDENVTKTAYKSSYMGKNSVTNDSRVNKVEEVCTRLREIMEKNSSAYLQPILISLVKNQKRSGLEAALRKVREIMDMAKVEELKIELKSDPPSPKFDTEGRVVMDSEVPQLSDKELTDELGRQVDINGMIDEEEGIPLEKEFEPIELVVTPTQDNITPADEAMKYLMYMVNVNTLYDVALGMYDFDLVTLIAEKAQKDPKEYVPFLNDLAQLDDHYMKFSIDKYLKRYSSALDHIAKLPEKFDECLKFIDTHKLFAKAMRLFNKQPEAYKQIAGLYGEYLISKNNEKEAGIMFTKAGLYSEALQAFKRGGCVKEAIVTAAHKLNMGLREQIYLYEELVYELKEQKRYQEAAEVLRKHLNRPEDAVVALCDGRFFDAAWSDAHHMKRLDLIETHVKPGIYRHTEFLLEQLAKNHAEFLKYKTRLAVVREEAANRAAARLNFDDGDEMEGNNGLSDLLSDTTSIAGSTVSRSSRSSGRSYRSSKNRRKHERKMQSVKEGSAYEDLALIRALHGLVTQTYAMRAEIRSLGEMLLLIDGDESAANLYKAMVAFLKDINSSKQEIWPPNAEKIPEPVTADPNMPTFTLEPHLLTAPVEMPIKWRMDMFEEGDDNKHVTDK